MVKKTIALMSALALSLAAWAQTTTKSNDVVAFDNIEINSDFEVTFHQAEFYRVDYTFDTLLSDVVSVHVSGNTLYVSFNKKGMSSELKKTYKGRNASKPILKVSVYAPNFSNLTLSENAVFDAMGNRIRADVFQLTATDKARVNNLSVEAERAVLTLEKDAKAGMTVNAAQIEVHAGKASALEMLQYSDALTITTTGSASVTVSGETGDIVSNTQNSSKVTVSGFAESIRHDGKGSSEADLLNVPIKTAEAVMANSSKLYLSVSDLLKVDLKGGSSVIFNGNPEIDVVNIISSTLMHYSGKK